jgi:Protein of unknown function (DUF3618)
VGQEPEQLEREIIHTRMRLADTVDAISHKLDVRGRALAYVAAKRQAVVFGSRNGAANARHAADNPAVRRAGIAAAVAVVALGALLLLRRGNGD